MCGIVGKFNFNGVPVEEREIRIMAERIAHRGPDDSGVFVSGPLGLGHRRLAIIDLSPAGHQPMSDASGNYRITFNGEIYNFLDLRRELEQDGVVFKSRSDTEVIIYLYIKYGAACLMKLRGMFALAIWDTNKRELFVARDRVGKKPLKYYLDKQTFIFASELKAFLNNPAVAREVDPAALDEYLSLGYVPSPRTGFKNIAKLEPAHYLIVKESGEVQKKRYWDIDFTKKLTHTKPEWEEILLSKLREAVKIRLMADVPLGAHLSGGIDSSLIVALMAAESSTPIKTYSVGFAEQTYNELPYAKLVADRYGTEHHEIILAMNALELIPKLAYQYEEPFADNSAVPTWYLCRATRDGLTVALNGDGGDELFGGYYRYQAMAIHQLLRRIPGSKTLAGLARAVGARRAARLLALANASPAETYDSITNIFTAEEKKALWPEAFRAPRNIELNKNITNELDQILYAGFTAHLPGGLIPKVDIASMAHSLEVRSPLLDQELIELTAKMPINLKFNIWNKKIIFKKIARRFLPGACIDRPKQGFDFPIKNWLKATALEQIQENLLERVLPRLGFNNAALQTIVKKPTAGNDKKIWSLIMLAAWYDQFFKNQ
ncbi:MAG: asparagine synthase (glutamine-hydrolyzing) [Candidatus Magasanikbacteria bacterium]|nr:asparagine synthase (glutamine-hydrolyzing) [Candidatus Magasanikbacteria bacterium]